MQKHPGQSLAEYVVVGVLVALVSIAGLYLTGGNLKNLLDGLKSDMGKSNSASVAQAAKFQTQAQAAASPGASTTSDATSSGPIAPVPPNTMPSQICAPNGTCFANPVAGSTIATAGANGSALSESQATSIMALVQQLASEGAPDSTLDILTTLALKNHQQAIIENQMEQELAANGGTLPADRATYFYQQIYGIREDIWAAETPYNNMKTSLPQTSMWAIDNAEASASEMAASYNEWTAMVTGQSGFEGKNPSDPASYSAGSSGTPVFTASVPTQGDANTICSNGGNTGQCVKNGFPATGTTQ